MTTTPMIAPQPAARAPQAQAGNPSGADGESAHDFAKVVKSLGATEASASERADDAPGQQQTEGSGRAGAPGQATAPGLRSAPGLLTAPGLLKAPGLVAAAGEQPAGVATDGLSLIAAEGVAEGVTGEAVAAEALAAEALAAEALAAEGVTAGVIALPAVAAVPLLAEGVAPAPAAVPSPDIALVAPAEDGVALSLVAGDAALTEPTEGVTAARPALAATAQTAVLTPVVADADAQARSQQAAHSAAVVTATAPPAVGLTLSLGQDGGNAASQGDGAAAPASPEQTVASASLSESNLLVGSSLGLNRAEAVTPAAAAVPGTPAGTAAQLAGAVFSVQRRGVEGTRQLTIDVTPEELGPIRLTVTIRAGEVNILMGGSSELSREALRQAMPELRKLLEASGVATGSFDVSPEQPDNRPDWAGSAGGSAHDARDSGTRGRSDSAPGHLRAEAENALPGSRSVSPRATRSDRALDLHL